MPLPTDSIQPLIQWASDDSHPFHWGAAITVAVVTSRMRECERGDRVRWVDLLSELREADPHLHAVLAKRFGRTSSRQFEMQPADTQTEQEAEKAQTVADYVRTAITRIPEWKSHVSGLLWGGVWAGAGCREKMWTRSAAGEWRIESLHHVHSRRINYDTAMQPYINTGLYSSEGVYPAEHPGKFIMFEPRFADEYQTRAGVSRVCSYWSAGKRFAFRELQGYVERFGKPFPLATHEVGDRVADQNEVDDAAELVRKIGRGSQPGAVMPSCIKLELLGQGASSSSGGSGENTPHKALIAMADSQISRAVEGGDINTTVGETGSRALGQSQTDSATGLADDDATQLDEAVNRDVVWWIVWLNFGDAGLAYLPRYHTIVEEDEDLSQAADTLDKLVTMGLRVPTSWAYAKFNVPQPAEGEDVLGKAAPAQVPPPPGDDEDEEQPDEGAEDDGDAQ